MAAKTYEDHVADLMVEVARLRLRVMALESAAVRPPRPSPMVSKPPGFWRRRWREAGMG